MTKGLAVWQAIKDSLDNAVPIMLLYVLESRGSSPGRQGFLMMVTAEKMKGSIGGGIMEHKLVEKARANLQWATGNGQYATGNMQGGEIIRQVHNKAASKNQSGMICSGEQTVLHYRVQQKDSGAIHQIISCLTNLQSAMLALSPQGILFEQAVPALPFSFQYKTENDWIYKEQLGYANHLYIIGGGHCSLALSNLMSVLDFYIHVYDDRQGLPTMDQNLSAHEKILVHDYNELASCIPAGKNNYVAIMTVGYRTDDIAVRALLNKEFVYIGLLGSKAKIKKMLDGYRAEGFDEGRLQKLYAPIGLTINSRTPEEIAVSIAAQIIAVKNA